MYFLGTPATIELPNGENSPEILPLEKMKPNNKKKNWYKTLMLASFLNENS